MNDFDELSRIMKEKKNNILRSNDEGEYNRLSLKKAWDDFVKSKDYREISEKHVSAYADFLSIETEILSLLNVFGELVFGFKAVNKKILVPVKSFFGTSYQEKVIKERENRYTVMTLKNVDSYGVNSESYRRHSGAIKVGYYDNVRETIYQIVYVVFGGEFQAGSRANGFFVTLEQIEKVFSIQYNIIRDGVNSKNEFKSDVMRFYTGNCNIGYLYKDNEEFYEIQYSDEPYSNSKLYFPTYKFSSEKVTRLSVTDISQALTKLIDNADLSSLLKRQQRGLD